MKAFRRTLIRYVHRTGIICKWISDGSEKTGREVNIFARGGAEAWFRRTDGMAENRPR